MSKKSANRRKTAVDTPPEEDQGGVIVEDTPQDLDENPDQGEESDLGLVDLPLDGEEEFEDEDQGLPPAPKKKRGRKPRQDLGPLSLTDIVNGPQANEAWWQEHRLVIYRKDVSKDMKALMKSNSGRTWIDRISGPFSVEFDEHYIKQQYGGGLFQVYLQEKPTGGNRWDALMDTEYVISGPPKYTEEESAARRVGNPSPASSEPGAQPQGELAAVLSLLQRQIDRAEAPQAMALQSFAETLRAGQAASTEMLMATMRQVIEMRGNGQQSRESDKLVEILLGMVKDKTSQTVEPQKTGIEQIQEMVKLQALIRELSPKRESSPFDDVAKELMMQAARQVIPGAQPPVPVRGSGGAGWGDILKDLLTPLIPRIPELIQGVGAYQHQQHVNRMQQINHEAQLRERLIRLQRGEAAPELPAQTTTPEPAPQDQQAQQAQEAQRQEQIRQAAQMEQFIASLTQMFFSSEDPQDAAITLSAAFPQITAGLRQQLAAYPEWWSNQPVLGFLRNTYPTLRPVLDHPRFPKWIAQVWNEFDQAENEDENMDREGHTEQEATTV